MQGLENAEQTVKLITEKTGKQEKEIQELIERKMEKYSGMLSAEGAAFMVAKDLKVELNLERRISEKKSIADIKAGMSGIDLEVSVAQAFQSKSFEKNGRKGKMLSLIVSDASGETRLTLWHEQAKAFEEKKIEKGAKIGLHNCRVQEFQGKAQLSLDYNGKLELLQQGKQKTAKIEDLKEGMQNIDIVGRVARAFPARKFVKENKEGKVASFELYDGISTIRISAWNELAEEVEGLRQNELLKIENAYSRQGLKALELHLGWQARIIREPETMEKIPEVAQRQYPQEKFAELEDNKAFEQKALVLDLNFGKLFFEVCPKCGRKPESIDNAIICENCGQIEETEKRLVVSAMLDDGTAVLRTMFFGKQAEDLVGFTAKELLEKEREGKLNDTMQKLFESIAGEEVIVQGIARTNAMNGNLEITARNIQKLGKGQGIQVETEKLD